MRSCIRSSLAGLALLFWALPSLAIRPFVTDDARVVGHKLAQLETWLFVDRFTLEQTALGAIGPTDWLELTVGLIHGNVHSGPERGYAITGPLLQGKALLHPALDGGWPGVAVSLGGLPPLGHGKLARPGGTGFGYVALTESLFGEGLLLHANLGLALGDRGANFSDVAGTNRLQTSLTAGFGFQARIVAGLHGVAELYHGDPFDPFADFPATQVGFRYIFTDDVQIDATVGSTLSAVHDPTGPDRAEQWGTFGLRLVTPELW